MGESRCAVQVGDPPFRKDAIPLLVPTVEVHAECVVVTCPVVTADPVELGTA